MEQAPEGVIGVDATHSLDRGSGDRLAVGHDRERLKASGRQPNRVRPDVAGDEGTRVRRRRELDPIPDRQQPDAPPAQRNLEVAEAPLDETLGSFA